MPAGVAIASACLTPVILHDMGQMQVKAFRLEPGQRVNDPEKGGIIDSDGEVLARWNDTCQSGQQKDLMRYGPPITLTIDQGLATIFSPLPS